MKKIILSTLLLTFSFSAYSLEAFNREDISYRLKNFGGIKSIPNLPILYSYRHDAPRSFFSVSEYYLDTESLCSVLSLNKENSYSWERLTEIIPNKGKSREVLIFGQQTTAESKYNLFRFGDHHETVLASPESTIKSNESEFLTEIFRKEMDGMVYVLAKISLPDNLVGEFSSLENLTCDNDRGFPYP